ncbi:PQQ-binding-like beta-propeller repeat protein [Streptomyces sp. B6B3]|uniref:outer membrane protein assembly factor BamB family protein n=1 Tax=Streptomyces sp. B6B3 TaxID=3153570 RepID=UPI00325DF0BD
MRGVRGTRDGIRGRLAGTATAALAVVAVAAAAGGCTGGDGGGGEPTPDGATYPPADALERLWAVPGGDTGVAGWSTPDTFATAVLPGTLRGYDPETGAERWRLALPEGSTEICAMSEEPNAAGIVAVVFRTPVAEGEFDDGFGGSCSTVGAVSLDDGDLLWSESLVDRVEYAAEPEVALGESVLTYAAPYGEVFRFRAADGEELSAATSPGPRTAVLGERRHVLLDQSGEEDWLRVRDAETDELLWERPAGENEGEPLQIVADDPDVPLLVLFDDGGQATLRAYDDTGEPRYELGPDDAGAPATENAWVPFRGPLVEDGVLVTGYADDPRLHAHDLTTGEELWSTPLEGGRPFAIQDGRLLVSVPEHPDDEHRFEQRLYAYDLHGGERTELGLVAHLHPWDPDGPTTPLETAVIPLATDADRTYVLHLVSGGDGPRILAYPLP